MKVTVGDVYGWIDSFAPFSAAMPWDNSGLLIGKREKEVTGILCALDATPQVAREAKELGAQLLITHHPLMFRSIQRLDEDVPEAETICELIRCGVSLIAAHTNFDIAPGGVNDSLLETLSWKALERREVLCLGEMPKETLGVIRETVEEKLGFPAVLYGNARKTADRFAVCSGAAGEEEAEEAAKWGAQVLLTGEMKHNVLLDAAARGVSVICAGHRATEIYAVNSMVRHLQEAINRLQLNVKLYGSRIDPFC